MMVPFIGRANELRRLKDIYSSNRSSLVVAKGRRRIGKSRLFQEFSTKHTKNTQLWDFSGLAPSTAISDQTQRDHFAKRLCFLLRTSPFTFHDWSDAFEHLSMHIQPGDIILFDEISWMGSKDPSFISKLKDWWDRNTIPVMLILCGSVSTWIEDNIINSTALFGRINLILALSPLSIPESMSFLDQVGFKGSSYDRYKLLCVLGGVPWYLEQVNKSMSAEENIKQLCFSQHGLLVTEFDRIFHDLFNTKGVTYKNIMNSLKSGMKTLAEIKKDNDLHASGTYSKLMNNLEIAGFVKKQQLWSFKTSKPLKQGLYRLADPYMRFYLKLIEPSMQKIKEGHFEQPHHSLSSLIRGLDAHIGLQIESLLLQNRPLLLKYMGIPETDIVTEGPYRQSQTKKRAGCQIDYLVQTSTNTIFVCEFKFKKKEIGKEIIQEVQKKIDALEVPRGFACVPVLFYHSSKGLSENLEINKYFYRMIDIDTFLGDI